MAVKELTTASFQDEVAFYPGTVIVDFWAPWCGPCRMLSPIVDELAEELPAVKVMKCNTDEEMALAIRFGIDAIPAVFKFKNGQLVGRSLGLVSKDELRRFMTE